MEQKYVTVMDAAVELGLDSSQVRRLCGAGRIQGAEKWGRDWRIPSPVVRLPGPPRGGYRPRRNRGGGEK